MLGESVGTTLVGIGDALCGLAVGSRGHLADSMEPERLQRANRMASRMKTNNYISQTAYPGA